MQQEADAVSLFEACRRNDTEAIALIVDADPQLMSYQDVKGFSPVLIAVYNGAEEAAQLLLQKGAPANLPDASGNTALMGASFKGYRNLVTALLDAGVDVNQRNTQGATALTFAATFGKMDIAEDLLEQGAAWDIPDSRGKTPIDHAVMQENEPMVRLLEKYEQRGR